MKKEVLSFPNFLVMNTELGYPILLCKGKVRIDSLFTYTQPGTKSLLSDMIDSFDLNPSSKLSPSSRVGRFLKTFERTEQNDYYALLPAPSLREEED